MSQGRTWSVIAIAGLLLIALAAGVLASTDTPVVSDEDTIPPVDIASVYDPVTAGEELPSGFRQVLDRDQIAPIYDPKFTTPREVDWPEEMLVIGVAIDGKAKAYPVTPLNQREMVIDSLAGIPILVTW